MLLLKSNHPTCLRKILLRRGSPVISQKPSNILWTISPTPQVNYIKEGQRWYPTSRSKVCQRAAGDVQAQHQQKCLKAEPALPLPHSLQSFTYLNIIRELADSFRDFRASVLNNDHNPFNLYQFIMTTFIVKCPIFARGSSPAVCINQNRLHQWNLLTIFDRLFASCGRYRNSSLTFAITVISSKFT